jgi:hypothetical protein
MEELGLASNDEHDREKSREGGEEAAGSGDGGCDGEEVVNWGLLQSRPLMQLRDDAPSTRRTINDIAPGRASLAISSSSHASSSSSTSSSSSSSSYGVMYSFSGTYCGASSSSASSEVSASGAVSDEATEDEEQEEKIVVSEEDVVVLEDVSVERPQKKKRRRAGKVGGGALLPAESFSCIFNPSFCTCLQLCEGIYI